MPPARRLAAILAADVAGYSRLMGADEEGTHQRLQAHLCELVAPKIAEHRGRVVKNTGDGFLAEYPSVVDAVRCALEVQRVMIDREPEVPDERRIRFRIGINLGDVIAEGEDIFGDGVNVAARLEALAEPGGICVSRMVRDQVRDKVDFVFEDLGEKTVKNIARPVRAYRVRDRAASIEQPSPAPPQPLPLPDKPSIAVLPFANMSGDPEQEYFADGMVEEIITALSRIRWLFVIARNSTFTYKGRAVDVTQVGRELGVRYVLEGSVRKAGRRVRITAQLIDTTTGAHLWADRFDGSLEDVFDLQDQVAISVVGIIEPTLEAAEIQRASRRPTANLHAYDLYLRALPHHLSFDAPQVVHALDLLNQAINQDPLFGPALALAGWCHVQLETLERASDLDANRRRGLDLARRATVAADDDPMVLGIAAFTLARFANEIEPSISLVDRALELNPSFARGWYVSGWLRNFAGQLDLSIEHFQNSARLNPRAQRAFVLYGIGNCHFFAGRFAEAVSNLGAAVQQLPNLTAIHRLLAASYAHLGRISEARETVERLRAITPVVIPRLYTHMRNPQHGELLISGLRLAMGEEI
jgi:TolB-like protein/class 3 adenylate cyclase